jgi:hypothetical protein
MPDHALAARLSILRKRHRASAKNLLAWAGPAAVARGRTAPPPHRDVMRAAEEAAKQLAERVKGHGWELPPAELRVKVHHLASGSVVVLLAGDGSGSFVVSRFHVPDDVTYGSAIVFVPVFDRHGLVPLTGMRW